LVEVPTVTLLVTLAPVIAVPSTPNGFALPNGPVRVNPNAPTPYAPVNGSGVERYVAKLVPPTTAHPPIIRFVNVGAVPKINCAFPYWLFPDDPSTPLTAAPNVPPVAAKFTVESTPFCVNVGALTTLLPPAVEEETNVRKSKTFAPAPIVIGPTLTESDPGPPKNCNVPPVNVIGAEPNRWETTDNPPLSNANVPNGTFTADDDTAAPSRTVTCPPRTVNVPVPRLLFPNNVHVDPPPLSKLIFPPPMLPEYVAFAFGTVNNVAVLALLFVIFEVPDP
jgi:hypothetical protein